ncbi:jg26105 [Pararge aegeria aegeria]|uniref:Jg26105 protein n=1 Tax=Pararge aegeria aegeria TaxID=348720 RepID=A0A8S4SD74_9NEOP|nr:jg26105 [Pararge aegeria aegeria]
MSSSSPGDGAREQRPLGIMVTVLVTRLLLEQYWRPRGRRARATRAAPACTPREHRTPKRPKCLRCTGPPATSPCNNISAHQYTDTLRILHSQ